MLVKLPRRFLSNLSLELLTEKHQSRETLKTSDMPGLCAGILTLSARFKEVQSRINWVSCAGVGLLRILELGCTCRTVFNSSGRSRW